MVGITFMVFITFMGDTHIHVLEVKCYSNLLDCWGPTDLPS